MDKKALKQAFISTIPVMIGFLFISIAFGLLLSDAGYGFPWGVAMAVVVYGGKLQFALIPLITSQASLLTVGSYSQIAGCVSYCSQFTNAE